MWIRKIPPFVVVSSESQLGTTAPVASIVLSPEYESTGVPLYENVRASLSGLSACREVSTEPSKITASEEFPSGFTRRSKPCSIPSREFEYHSRI